MLFFKGLKYKDRNFWGRIDSKIIIIISLTSIVWNISTVRGRLVQRQVIHDL